MIQCTFIKWPPSFFVFVYIFFSSAVTRLLIKKYFFFSNFNIDFISYITMIFFIFKKTCKFAHTKKYCKHLYQLSPYHATDLHVRSSIRTKGRDNV